MARPNLMVAAPALPSGTSPLANYFPSFQKPFNFYYTRRLDRGILFIIFAHISQVSEKFFLAKSRMNNVLVLTAKEL